MTPSSGSSRYITAVTDEEGDTVNGTVMVGQSLNVLNDVLPCQDVIERIIAEAKDAIERIKSIEF